MKDDIIFVHVDADVEGNAGVLDFLGAKEIHTFNHSKSLLIQFCKNGT